MLDLERYRRIRLHPRPRAQRFVAHAFLAPNYGLFPGVDLRFEGVENVPDEPVLFAMNHTDKYNYWPFQYRWYREHNRFTATWVKGKNYENRWMAAFLEHTNNIPAISRGYLIVRDFLGVTGTRPSDAQYAALRGWLQDEQKVPDANLPPALLQQPRNILGRAFDPDVESYPQYIRGLLGEMMACFLQLNDQAAEVGLDLLVFPQGTRSKRLSRGHIGISQIALHQRRPIVPVGCSGSDQVYPGSSPWAKSGRITYRFGAPITREKLAEYAVPGGFTPFDPSDERTHKDRLQKLSSHIMDRINPLVDEPYRFSEDLESEGVQGTNRFV